MSRSESRSIESLALKAINDYSFDFNEDRPPKREFIISILEVGHDNEIYEVGLVSNGGILEVIGKKGSRKTAFLSMLPSAAFAPDNIFGNIKVALGDRTIIWFDTEMPGDDFWYFQKRLYEQCGLSDNHPRITSINMDYFETAREKLEVMLHILQNSNNPGNKNQYFQNIGLIVLDGIADLIGDTGNEQESREVLDKIKSTLNSMDACLVTVLHSDKKGQHSRGTLGTLLDQKASAAVMMDMKNPGEETVVRPEKVRNGRLFRPYKLTHDVDGTILINGMPNGMTQRITAADFIGQGSSPEN